MKLILACTSLMLLISTSFSAQADSPFKNNFELTLGAYFPSIDTSFQIDPKNGLGEGTTFDFEDIFGLEDDTTQGFGGLLYRFNEHHAIEATYFDLSRNGSKAAVGDITVGDTTFEAGALIDTDFDYEVYRVSYIYNFLTASNYAVGASIGAHITKIGIGLDSTLVVDDTVIKGSSERADTTAPLPVIGLRGDWRIAENWIIDAGFDWFGIKIDDYKGNLINVGVAIEYDQFKYVSVGAGWDYYNLNIEADKSNFKGEIDYEYSGPMLYIKGRY